MNNENQNFNQIPVPNNTNGMSNDMPMPNNNTMNVDSLGSMGTQNLDTLNTTMPGVIPNASPVNLNPPGMIPPAVPTEQNEAPTVEPLMGTNIGPNNNVNLNPPQPSINPGVNMNNMVGGMVPPTNNTSMFDGVPVPPSPSTEPPKEKKKGKMNKILLIVLIAILIAVVGFGVYYFLVLSKKNAVTITPIIGSEIELGSPLTENVLSYVSLSGITSSQCTLKSNVDVKKAGTYEWSVTCGSKTTGSKTVTVKDTKGPEVKAKDLIVVPNKEVNPEDFIESATDASEEEGEISFAFEDESTFDVTKEGTYDVTIVASDAYQNTTTVTAKLTVSNDAPSHYLECGYEDISKTYPKATVNVYFRYGITTSNTLYDNVKIVEYVFDDETYDDALGDVTDDGFDGLKGKVITNDTNYTIRVEINVTKNDLAKEFGESTFPDTEDEIESLHDNRGDACTKEE